MEESLRDVFRNAYRRNSMSVLFETKKFRKDDRRKDSSNLVGIYRNYVGYS